MSVASTADPSTAAEAAEALRAAAVSGQRVRIAGNGTKLGWGNPIAPPDIELRTTSMARVIAHNEGDFTAIVEPGLPFATLQSELATKGQMLAIDPPADEATVGGVFAAADSGPLRHRFHAPRDLIIGVQLALADGSVARAGGTVIKNVAGYDLAKLFTGSFGTLGLIAQIAVRLHPLPQGIATAVGRSDDPAKIAAGAAACAREPLEADAFDVGWDAQGGAILVRLSGETASARVAETLPLLADEAHHLGQEHDDAVGSPARRAALARRRRGRSGGRPTSLRLVLESAREAGATLVGRARSACRGCASTARPTTPPRPASASCASGLRPPRSRSRTPRPPCEDPSPWGPVDPARLALMSSVKDRFDPTGACAPGLFVGGL